MRPILIALLAVPLVVVMSAARPIPEPASGHVVTIKMVDNGSTIFKFEPKNVRVQRGDTLRFEQTGAVPHNVELKHTPRGANLHIAAMGPFLLAKGATYDIVIDESFVDGKYEFECTPHQMFGMKGSFTVTGG